MVFQDCHIRDHNLCSEPRSIGSSGYSSIPCMCSYTKGTVSQAHPTAPLRFYAATAAAAANPRLNAHSLPTAPHPLLQAKASSWCLRRHGRRLDPARLDLRGPAVAVRRDGDRDHRVRQLGRWWTSSVFRGSCRKLEETVAAH